jgi:hypothetical protein
MLKKVIAIGGVTAALVAGPLGAGPASAQPTTIAVDLPCEVFADPYGYPCQTAEDTYRFVAAEAGDALRFVLGVRDEVGEVVFDAYCTAFPNQPECP